MAVRGIEGLPIFIVATEETIWSATPHDYISGVPLWTLIDRLQPGERVYLAHLDSAGTDGRIRVTDLLSVPPAV